VLIDEDIRCHVDVQNGFNQCHILVIGNSTTIVNLSTKVIQDLIRDLLIFIQQHFQLSLADGEIFHSEFVRDIPADCTEFSSVLDDCMEEAETKE